MSGSVSVSQPAPPPPSCHRKLDRYLPSFPQLSSDLNWTTGVQDVVAAAKYLRATGARWHLSVCPSHTWLRLEPDSSCHPDTAPFLATAHCRHAGRLATR